MGMCDFSNEFLAGAFGFGAFILLFFGAILNVMTCWVWVWMLLFSLAVGTLEAPTIMKLCESDYTMSFAKCLSHVTGIFRSAFYVLGSVPLFWCIEVTTVLAFLLLFASSFFHLAVWLGPRKGDATAGAEDSQKKEALITDEEREERETGAPSWAAAPAAADNSWNSFVETAATKAVVAAAPAIAAAAVQQVVAQGNPFMQQSPAAPTSPGPTMTGDVPVEGAIQPDPTNNPFAGPG